MTWNRFVAPVLLLLFIILQIFSASRESLTFDEVVHVEEGIRHITTHEFLVDTNNPPLVRTLAALPIVFAQRFFPSASLDIYFLGRIVIIFLSTLCAISIYRVSTVWFGRNVGMMSLFLYLFEPTIGAHSHYVTLDVGVMVFVFWAMLCSIRFFEYPTRIRAVVWSISLGLAWASKVYAIPYTIIVGFMYAVWSRYLRSHRFIGILVGGIVLGTLSLCVVWMTYWFRWDVVIVERSDENRLSSKVIRYAKEHNIPVLEHVVYWGTHVPIPLGNYIAVLKNTSIRATLPTRVFFDGTYYTKSSWTMMFMTLLWKLPIPLIICFVVGLFSLRKYTMYILTPILGITILGSFLLPPLIRYMLPLYPWIVLVASVGIVAIAKNSTLRLFIFIGMLGYISSYATHYPHTITYANELAGARDKRYTKFTDSNLDWGQGLDTLAGVLKKRDIGTLQLSYFGRDDGVKYGLASRTAYGGYKKEDICDFHSIPLTGSDTDLTIISSTNWYDCGYNTDARFQKDTIREVIADVFLVF